MDRIKIHGFYVYQRVPGGNYQIEFTKNFRRSLGTKDFDLAERRAKKNIGKYLQQKLNKVEAEVNKGNIKISKYAEGYLKYRKTKVKLSTIETDNTAISQFIKVIGDVPIKNVTSDIMEIFKNQHLMKKNGKKKVTKTSINTYLRHLQVFFKRAYKQGLISKPLKIEKYKTGEVLVKFFTDAEREKLLEYARKKDYRMYRIMIFGFFTGCRRSEILNLKWKNCYKDTVKVKGKGSKERTVPLIGRVKEILNDPRESEFVFWQIHPRNYTKIFKRYARACGIHGRSFHGMRHTAGTSMLEAGVPLHVVQKIFGHSSIAVTQKYAKVVDKYMLDEFQKFDNANTNNN